MACEPGREIMPTYFPDINVSVVAASHPGIQVVDFLLWALNRKFAINDDTWLRYSGYKESTSWHIEGDPLQNKQFSNDWDVLAEEPMSMDFLSFAKPINQDLKPDQMEIIELYCTAEKAIRIIGRNLPNHALHFRESIEALLPRLQQAKITKSDVKELASLFIQVVDTVPLYPEGSAKGFN